MIKYLWNSLLITPAVLGMALSVGIAGASGKEVSISPDSNENSTHNQKQKIDQVTSVSQLSDVQPTDWAFQALQSLVERYGCIAGYPNGTYRGNRAMTRYEFAAGLNACLEKVNQLIAIGTEGFATREDLAILQRLQEEFSAELATLRGRVDSLEARTAELEANQFSTTTKLQGEVVAAFTDVLDGGTNNSDSTAFAARTRIEFVTSFTGKDTLFTRLAANNIVSPDIGTPEGSFSFAGDDGTTDIVLDALYYQFPLGKSTQVIAIATGGAADDVADTVNIFDGDGGAGALSNFGTRNPIYYHMDGSGVGITQQLGDKLELSLGYLANSADDPGNGNGVFNGGYGALAQLTFKPSDRLTIGLTYINAYNQELTTGSNRANPRTLLGGIVQGVTGNPDAEVPTSSNSYGIEASFKLSDKLVLGGWVGYTHAQNLSTDNGAIDRGDVDIWNWAVTLGFPDLGKEGNLAGIIVGMEPKVTSSSINEIDEDNDTSLHIEAFYQYQINDNIAITPGIIWLTAPDHDSDNDDVFLGVIRTTFSF